MIRPRSGRWANWSRAARRSTTPTAPSATRPAAWAAASIKALVGSPVVLDADKGLQITTVLNGRNTMPAWKQLSDTELAAVITYTKNSWTNKTGQIVQPAEVVAARK